MSRLRMGVLAAGLMVCLGWGGAVETGMVKHTIEMAAKYPKLGVEAADRTVAEWLEEHVFNAAAGFLGVTLNPYFDESTDGIEIDYTLSRPSDRALSIVFRTVAMPFHAAHPSTRTDVVNLDMATGRMLGIEDIFGKPDTALAVMSAAAREKVMESYRADPEKQLPKEAASDDFFGWFEDGFEPTPINYAALVLVPDGIKVVFQQYQILAYVFGMPEAHFTLDELEAAEPDLALWGR